jgi:hypothetical protein
MILNIDTNICFECGASGNIHNHHIVPKSLGGTKTIPLCVVCHGRVHQKDFVKFQNLARLGRKKYVENGGKLGRKTGTVESDEQFMAKPINQEIKRLVESGVSVRNIVKLIRVSSKTILKVRKSIGVSSSTIVKVRKIIKESKKHNEISNTFF